jgi:riboflavin synthase
MFTGIIQTIGHITHIAPLVSGQDFAVTVQTSSDYLSDVMIGDSIAMNGACMTVVAFDEDAFVIHISQESLSKTTGLQQIGRVNLEKALRLQDRIGGHLVTGHVDGLGVVHQFHAVGDSWYLAIHAPRNLAKFIAYKGSITVNGVSLTVNQVQDAADNVMFCINVIPHTLQVTTLGQLQIGQQVNLEIDVVARYCERMLTAS